MKLCVDPVIVFVLHIMHIKTKNTKEFCVGLV